MSLPARIRKLFPKRPKVAVDVRIRKRVRFDCGERLTLEYRAADSGRIEAVLLVPDRKPTGPLPALIASHQHNGQYELGKSESAGIHGDLDMAYGLELCARGYVVLCPDHLGFEGRQQKRKAGRHVLEGKPFEQFLFGNAILHGGSLAATYLFDLQQAVDVLAGLDFVDASRLGVIGHSLGGQTALWLAAMDLRIKVAFSSCGFSQVETIQHRHLPHNCALYLPGLLQVGDMDDVVVAIAPRAFGMSHGLSDGSFPVAGVRQIHERAAVAFSDANLLRILFQGGHAFPARTRRRAYDFIDIHLK